MQQKKIVFLASDCESSRWVYNALTADFNIDAVILEPPLNKGKLIKNRIKKIGLLTVIGQIMFTALAVPFLKMIAKKRKAALMNRYQLNGDYFESSKIRNVATVNGEDCMNMLHLLQPDIIIVNGTRIISKKILQCTNAIFINMHLGITPYYRGSHGGYWALYNNDVENFGTTIHVIDSGVDTGAVIKQVFTKTCSADNFTTYPVLQTAIGINTLQEVLPALLSGNYDTTSHTEKGKLYYQPTLWQYFSGHTR